MVSFVDKYQRDLLLGVEYENNRILLYVDIERKTSIQNIITNIFTHINGSKE